MSRVTDEPSHRRAESPMRQVTGEPSTDEPNTDEPSTDEPNIDKSGTDGPRQRRGESQMSRDTATDAPMSRDTTPPSPLQHSETPTITPNQVGASRKRLAPPPQHAKTQKTDEPSTDAAEFTKTLNPDPTSRPRMSRVPTSRPPLGRVTDELSH